MIRRILAAPFRWLGGIFLFVGLFLLVIASIIESGTSKTAQALTHLNAVLRSLKEEKTNGTQSK